MYNGKKDNHISLYALNIHAKYFEIGDEDRPYHRCYILYTALRLIQLVKYYIMFKTEFGCNV